MGFCGSFCKCFGETLIIILNILTILVGILTTAVGVLFSLYWQLPAVSQYFTDLIQQHIDADIPNLTETYSALSSTMQIVGYVVASIGAALLISGVLGCCSAVCRSRCLMATYGVLLGLLSIGLITSTIVVASDHQIVIRPVEQWFNERVHDEFTDPLNSQSETTPVGYAATVIMIDLQCCGVTTYTEFQTCERWNKQYSNDGLSINAVVPSGCCKNMKTLNTTVHHVSHCLAHPNSSNSNIDTPCFPIISDYLEIAIFWSLTVLGSIGGVLGFLFVYTMVLVYIYARKTAEERRNAATRGLQEVVNPSAAFEYKKV